jgi:serine protease Do
VLDVLAQISKGGVERGWLGVSIQPLDRDLAAYLGQPETTGVIVNSVVDGSPAERAGLRAGDIVVALGTKRVEAEKEEDLGDFQRLVARSAPGTKLQLEVLRDGKRKQITSELAAQPTIEPAEAESDLGFQVQEVTENLYRAERLPTREGAYVSFVTGGTPAAEAGLNVGDVVVRLGESDVANLAEFRAAVTAAAGAERVLVHARRGSDLRFLLLKRGAKPAPVSEPADRADDASLRKD